MFSAKVSNYAGHPMLNICDAELLGQELVDGDISVKINPTYYGGKMMDRQEAKRMLASSSIINMVGRDIISMSTSMGVGIRDGIRTVSGIPFLIVFKM